jgi:hypothetical protein
MDIMGFAPGCGRTTLTCHFIYRILMQFFAIF